MTKTQIALTAILDGQISAELLEQVIAATASVRGVSLARPILKEIDGVEYKWCNRHSLYEPLTSFLMKSNGKEYNPECAAATLKWKAYGKEINTAMKAGEFETLGRLTTLRKKGGYDLANDIEEFADELDELGITQDINDAQPE